jgi:hypothetical protein
MLQTWRKQRYSQVIIRIKFKTGMGKSGVGYGLKQVGANGNHEGIFPPGYMKTNKILTSSGGGGDNERINGRNIGRL